MNVHALEHETKRLTAEYYAAAIRGERAQMRWTSYALAEPAV